MSAPALAPRLRQKLRPLTLACAAALALPALPAHAAPGKPGDLPCRVDAKPGLPAQKALL